MTSLAARTLYLDFLQYVAVLNLLARSVDPGVVGFANALLVTMTGAP